jgi:hypothetical protein
MPIQSISSSPGVELPIRKKPVREQDFRNVERCQQANALIEVHDLPMSSAVDRTGFSEI